MTLTPRGASDVPDRSIDEVRTAFRIDEPLERLRHSIVVAIDSFRAGVKGDDANGELADWFRPAYLRDVAADMERLWCALESAHVEIAALTARSAALEAEKAELIALLTCTCGEPMNCADVRIYFAGHPVASPPSPVERTSADSLR